MENVRYKTVFCCCRMFWIQHGIYLIVLHCIVHGIYGVLLILSSSYKSEHAVAIYIALASNLCLFPLGIFIFWANIYESWKGAILACIITVIVTLFNVVSVLYYFIQYCNFTANSLLDRFLFSQQGTSWTTSADVPFTMWHALTFVLLLVHCLWFYYSFILYNLSIHLRRKLLL